MIKIKMLVIRITEEQEKILKLRTEDAGFSKKSEYVRTLLFKGEQDGSRL